MRKSVEEKAELFVDKNIKVGGFLNYTEVKSELIKLLKGQDRDTRHDCANEVLELPRINHDVSVYNFGPELVDIDDVHNAIMNTKAV